MIPYADPAALIDDPQVLRVAITDNGEPLIVVRTISALAALAVDQSRADVQQISENPFHVRAGVAEKLTRAQAALPDGYQLQVKEGWRRPGARTPGSSHGPASRPPHSTGGAVDVALVHDGRTAAPVTNAARRHRDILASAMDAAGFINYPAEWWHWSYGDRY